MGGNLRGGGSCLAGTWAGSGNTSPVMSGATDPRVTGLESVRVHCPQAKVKYVNDVHVDFI